MWNPESSFGSVFELNFQLSTFARLCHEERSFPTQEMLQRSRSQGLHNVDDWFCHGFLGQQSVNFSTGKDGKSSNIRSCHLHLVLMAKQECHFNMTFFYSRILWNTLDSLNDANTNLNKPHQLDDNSNEFWHFFEHQNFKTYAIQPTFDATLPSQRTTSCLVAWTLISRIPLGNVIHINESSIRMPYEKHQHPSYHKPRHHIMDKTMALFPDIVRYTLNQTCSKFQQLCFLVDLLISCDSVLNVTDWPGFTANVRMHKHTPVAYFFVACSF